MHYRNTIILAMLFVSTPVFAANLIVSDLDYYQELPVILSTSTLSRPLPEAPNAMTMMNRKMVVQNLFKQDYGVYILNYVFKRRAYVTLRLVCPAVAFSHSLIRYR